jgi:hypothetical protein
MKPRSTTSLGGLLLALTATIASGAVYVQSFNAANGTTGTGLGDGSSINGSGDAGYFPAVRGGQLELTNAANTGTSASFIIPSLAQSSLGFTVNFDLTLADTAGGNPPADGFSFTYGNTFNTTSLFGEEGPGGTNSISWIVDTWDNGAGDRGIRSKVNGTNDYVQTFIPLADGQTIAGPVTLSWHPTDGMSMNVAGNQIFTNRAITGFTADDSYLFGFGARTGGATETVWIDNLNITSVPEPTLASLLGLGGLLAIFRRRR